MLRRSAKKKPKKGGRRPERVEIYLRKEVQKALDKNRRRDGKRGKPLARSAYIAALIMRDTDLKPQPTPETSPS